MKLTLATRNAAGLAANFYAADRRVQRAVRRVVERAGVREFERARADAPVDTGFMRSQLRLAFSEHGYLYELGFDEADFTGAGKPFYPLYVIFGTTKMPARDFLFGARDALRPAFRADLAAELRAAVRRRSAT